MDPYIGEIRIFAGNFAPKDWAFCNGQLLPISQNTALFSILGIMYGGDGKSTFALPNLQGAAPMHAGDGPGLTPRTIGEYGGEQTVTLLEMEMPLHSHAAVVGDPAYLQASPEQGIWSKTQGRLGAKAYSDATNPMGMNPQAIQVSGGSQPHNNMQPYLGLNFIIALQGVFPPRG